MSFQIGTWLNERYRLDTELGQGGLGVVFKAHDSLLERDVAIKLLSAARLSPESRTRLLHEARAAARLNHPNIVSAYDVSRVAHGDGIPFIVMELVAGESLHIRRPVAVDEILAITRQVCVALAHAHERGLVHRDLKPENVLITPAGVAKLTDFGLALSAPRSRPSQLGTDGVPVEPIVGTVFYLAPEQALGGEIDGRTDLYALGVMLYELTTGRLPFTGDDPLAVIAGHLQAPVLPPSTHAPALPPALDDLIVRLLSKDPAERPASAAQVGRILDGILAADDRPAAASAAAVPSHLLATKLYVPPLRRDLVPRSRLIERLNAGLGHKLTLISAPAGFGKTTLLSEWIHRRDEGRGEVTSPLPRARVHSRVAWLSLDPGDNDPAQFWTYVIAALRAIAPDIGQSALALLEAPPMPAVLAASQAHWSSAEGGSSHEAERTRTALTALINEIAAMPLEVAGQPTFILVLDDYHVIETAVIHEALAFLLDHLPPPERGLHLVIASRSDPPLPLSRLRGRQQLTELRAGDLRFTPQEAAAFLNQVMGLGLSAQDVAALEARTEGWIVGLQMAALALSGRRSAVGERQGPQSPEGFIRSFTGSHRYILDYLTDEVLLRQPPDVQTFLLRTAVLERLCGSLCDVLCSVGSPAPAEERLGSDSGQDMLERLDAANLFIVPLDEKRKWYRYHHLFGDLLRQRLGRKQPELVPALHLRASEWYARQGLINDAVSHALAAPDYEQAADLVQKHAGDAFSRGEFKLVLRWLEALPEDVVRSRPILCVCYGWAATAGTEEPIERAERWMGEAQAALAAWSAGEDLPRAHPPLFDSVISHLAAFRAVSANWHRETPERVIELSRQALEVVPESESGIRGILVTQLGVSYLNLGDEEAADRALIDAVRLGKIGGFTYTALLAVHLRADIARRRGRLREAARMRHVALESMVEPIERSGRRVPVGAYIYISLGEILLEWNDLQGAERALTKGLELHSLMPFSDLQIAGTYELARLRCAQGQAVVLSDLDELVDQEQGWIARLAATSRARIWLMQVERPGHDAGCLEAAWRWAQAGQLEPQEWNWGIREQLTRARAFIAHRRAAGSGGDRTDLAPVQSFLDEQLHLVEERGWTGHMIETLVVQALAFQALAQEDQALVTLERALALAEPEGHVRVFLDEGRPMARMLYQLAERGRMPDYVGRLLAAFDLQTRDEGRRTKDEAVAAARRVSSSVLGPSSALQALSARETEVLQLVAEGLTNREIARQLVISVSTVKRHTANIYNKLDVHSRTQAVAQAKRLGLLCD